MQIQEENVIEFIAAYAQSVNCLDCKFIKDCEEFPCEDWDIKASACVKYLCHMCGVSEE